jgi:hypothetical protein
MQERPGSSAQRADPALVIHAGVGEFRTRIPQHGSGRFAAGAAAAQNSRRDFSTLHLLDGNRLPSS